MLLIQRLQGYIPAGQGKGFKEGHRTSLGPTIGTGTLEKHQDREQGS
jgi:hypothetical protein